MLRVIVAQFEGATTLRVPPLAAGILVATLRKAPDLAAIGSPYCDGTFDALLASGELAPVGVAVFETNRGCPFACTFCDWGQAIESRVNELPIERVLADLRWGAARGLPYFYFIDAN